MDNSLKNRNDFLRKTSSIYEALSLNMPSTEHEDARKFFLQSTTTRIAIVYIMKNFFEYKLITASDVYSELSPRHGSKSSIVNFISKGFKKDYFYFYKNGDDNRKKYLFPTVKFTKIWCAFLSRSEGVPIDEKVNWKQITSPPDFL
jgi:hypothetical protein